MGKKVEIEVEKHDEGRRRKKRRRRTRRSRRRRHAERITEERGRAKVIAE